jgi:hypothetical protein
VSVAVSIAIIVAAGWLGWRTWVRAGGAASGLASPASSLDETGSRHGAGDARAARATGRRRGHAPSVARVGAREIPSTPAIYDWDVAWIDELPTARFRDSHPDGYAPRCVVEEWRVK